MKVIFVYNPYNTPEVMQLNNVVRICSDLNVEGVRVVDGIQASDVDSTRREYPISRTPALIVVRDDWQGPEMIHIDDDPLQMRAVLEILKQYDEMVKNMYDTESVRLDMQLNEEYRRAVYAEWEQIRMKLAAMRGGVNVGTKEGVTEFDFWNTLYHMPGLRPQVATTENVQEAVSLGLLTAEEYKTITGEDYPTE